RSGAGGSSRLRRPHHDCHLGACRLGERSDRAARARAGALRRTGRDETGAGRQNVGGIYPSRLIGPIVDYVERIGQVPTRIDRVGRVALGDCEVGKRPELECADVAGAARRLWACAATLVRRGTTIVITRIDGGASGKKRPSLCRAAVVGEWPELRIIGLAAGTE